MDNPMSSLFMFALNQHKIPKIILGEARKRKQIVYGARATNIQLPLVLRRHTVDFDLFTGNAKASARRMQRLLDTKVAGGRDAFFSKPAKYKGTHRVYHKGPDGKPRTRDDIHIVDYTSPAPRGIATVKIHGVRYKKLSAIQQGKEKLIVKKSAEYRRVKDISDLGSVQLARALAKLRRL